MLTRLPTLRPPRWSLVTATLAVALTLATAAPASPQTAPERQEDRAPVKLVVQNNNVLNVHIYVEGDGYSWPVGFVDGLSEASFKIPRNLTNSESEFRLRVDPMGSRLSYTTDAILMGTGSEVDLIVANDLGFTTFTVK
jgi:hypothetical protein